MLQQDTLQGEKIINFFPPTWQVFEFLIRLHSAEASPEEEIYPYVRTLLHFDTREFLNVLALVRYYDFKVF